MDPCPRRPDAVAAPDLVPRHPLQVAGRPRPRLSRRTRPRRPSNAAQRTDFQTARDVSLPVPPQLTAGDEFFEFVFSGSGHSYETLKALAAKQEPLPDIALRDVSITINVDAEYDVVQTRLTRNVVGFVRGTDAKLRDTYVASAHTTITSATSSSRRPAAGAAGPPRLHGQTRPTPRPGDNINNGADDDGSGIVSLMAIAKAFATGQKPKRSVLFVWHSGEEGGLLGSATWRIFR